jgi:hypothetical protein
MEKCYLVKDGVFIQNTWLAYRDAVQLAFAVHLLSPTARERDKNRRLMGLPTNLKNLMGHHNGALPNATTGHICGLRLAMPPISIAGLKPAMDDDGSSDLARPTTGLQEVGADLVEHGDV